MKSTSGTPTSQGSAGVYGKSGSRGESAANEMPVVGLRGARVAPTRGRDDCEDWQPLVTADPAFWLKGVER